MIGFLGRSLRERLASKGFPVRVVAEGVLLSEGSDNMRLYAQYDRSKGDAIKPTTGAQSFPRNGAGEPPKVCGLEQGFVVVLQCCSSTSGATRMDHTAVCAALARGVFAALLDITARARIPAPNYSEARFLSDEEVVPSDDSQGHGYRAGASEFYVIRFSLTTHVCDLDYDGATPVAGNPVASVADPTVVLQKGT